MRPRARPLYAAVVVCLGLALLLAPPTHADREKNVPETSQHVLGLTARYTHHYYKPGGMGPWQENGKTVPDEVVQKNNGVTLHEFTVPEPGGMLFVTGKCVVPASANYRKHGTFGFQGLNPKDQTWFGMGHVHGDRVTRYYGNKIVSQPKGPIRYSLKPDGTVTLIDPPTMSTYHPGRYRIGLLPAEYRVSGVLAEFAPTVFELNVYIIPRKPTTTPVKPQIGNYVDTRPVPIDPPGPEPDPQIDPVWTNAGLPAARCGPPRLLTHAQVGLVDSYVGSTTNRRFDKANMGGHTLMSLGVIGTKPDLTRPFLRVDVRRLGVTAETSGRAELQLTSVFNPKLRIPLSRKARIKVYRLLGPWIEGTGKPTDTPHPQPLPIARGTLSWANQPRHTAKVAFAVTEVVGSTVPARVSFDITGLVRFWLQNLGPAHGLILAGEGAGDGTFLRYFVSREGRADQAPRIVIWPKR